MSLAPGLVHREVVPRRVSMALQLRRITKEFEDAIGGHQSQLARILKVKPQTVQSWFKTGRISAWGAMQIAKHFPAWSKERLRPDILDWKSLRVRVPGRV